MVRDCDKINAAVIWEQALDMAPGELKLKPAMRAFLVCVALALVAAGAGCSAEKATQIVVAIATNLSVPKELDSVDLLLERKGQVKANLNYILDPNKPGFFELPATVAIHAGKDPSIPITITLSGKKGNAEVVTRKARLAFIEGRILLLKMDLLWSCVQQHKKCGTDQTCTDKGCVSMNVDPGKLPDYSTDKAFSSPEAGAVDAAVDLPAGDLGGDAVYDAGPDGPGPDEGSGDGKMETSADLPTPDISPDVTQPDTAPTGTITVTAPTGGSHAAGSKLTITWTSTGSVASVDIELYRGTKKESTVAQKVPNGGSFIWTIPAYQPRDSTYLIKVVSAQNSSVTGASPYFTIDNWQYRVSVTIDATKSTSALTNYPLAISLTSTTFTYGNAKSDGADLRFSSSKTLSGTFDLDHWIQKWNPTGSSVVWVNVPSIPAGSTKDIHLFYGRSGATSTSSKSKTFPKMFISTGGLSLGGSFTYDWFELKAGHTLTLNSQKSLSITARRIIIDGTVQGTGLGSLGGKLIGQLGAGLGGGGVGASAGGGGGAYGGNGGKGGHDNNDVPGQGGKACGSKDSLAILMGSGGGAGTGPQGKPAGNGGGAVTLSARDVVVSGTITMDGTMGASGDTCGGGGSGGGVLIQGDDVSLSGGLSVKGGDGGSGPGTASDGGGGGGGGRVKVFYESNLSNKAIVSSTGGNGGKFGTVSFGSAGGGGSSHFGQTKFGVTTVALGVEKKL